MKILRKVPAAVLAAGLSLNLNAWAQETPPAPNQPETPKQGDAANNAIQQQQDVPVPQQPTQAVEQRKQQPQAQEPQQGEQQQKQDPAQQEQRQNKMELGVRLLPSQTRGILVQDIRPGGVADQAGVRRGDYLLSIGDQKVNSPEELSKALSGKKAGEQVTIEVWRDGASEQLTATLQAIPQPPNAPKEGDQPDEQWRRHTAMRPNFEGQQDNAPWIGIWMEEAMTQVPQQPGQPAPDGQTDQQQQQQQGVAVRHVFPSGPAARGGVRDGDVIVAVGDKKLVSPQELIDQIGSMKAKDTVQFQIVRGGQSVTVPVVVGVRSDYADPELQQFNVPGGQFAGNENAYNSVPDQGMMLEQNRRFAEQQERLEKLVLELKDEVRQLREQLRQRDEKPVVHEEKVLHP